NRTNVNVQELAVKSFLERDRDAAFQACALDPLAAATVGLDDLKRMTAELFEANARWLEGYESGLPSSTPAAEPVGAAGRRGRRPGRSRGARGGSGAPDPRTGARGGSTWAEPAAPPGRGGRREEGSRWTAGGSSGDGIGAGGGGSAAGASSGRR